MTPVTRDQFYAVMNPRNVHPRQVGSDKYPYSFDWVDQVTNQVVGRSVGKLDEKYTLSHDYFLNR